MKVPVFTAAVAYDYEYTVKTYIFVIYNAFYLRNMDTNLVPPIMIRILGLDVDECPKFLSGKPMESNHSVYFLMSDIRLSFKLETTILYLTARTPLKVKLKESKGKYMLLTPKYQSGTNIRPCIGTKNIQWWTTWGISRKRVTPEAKMTTG